MSRPALFLDRDGVINEEVGYLYRTEDIRFMPGIVALLQTASRLRMFICVVTNQAGIGRGLYSERQFQELMRAMRTQLATQGAALDAVYHSPYHPEHGLGIYKSDTECRKPRPGMLLQAAREHGLDLTRSVMVGDRCSDMQAGAAAGVAQLFLIGGSDVCKDLVYRSIDRLESVTDYLLQNATAFVKQST